MIWWIIAVLCAYFVKGLCGFANTLVLTSILSFGSNNINISPVELLLAYPANAIVAFKERKKIKLRICLPPIILTILGSIPGIFFLKNTDAGVIKIFFGVVIILIGAEMLYSEYHSRKTKSSKAFLAIIGILSGFLSGAFSVGALLSAYINKVTEDTGTFKCNLCIVFLSEGTLRIILYIAAGIITFDIFKQALILVPVMLAGLALGILSSKFLNEKLIKKIVIILLIISGIALVVTNVP